ncbi:MAG: Clp1/GlmU family protein [Candidatus Bathyarchaeota archaeon]|nr:Clp1/GlmU family protein [Candidatus Bathyarchaeum sp.]
MKHVVDAGKTLLVDGPACVSVLSGNVSVLGALLPLEKNLVVREGKRLPLWVNEMATVELMLGEGACINEVAEGTVPSSWDEAVKELLALDKPVTVMVMGGVDSGKTSFCTFLVNSAVMADLRTGVIDADLGQSDVGPPSTVGFSLVNQPVKDLFELEAQCTVFVGSTSPSGSISKVVDGLACLKDRVLVAGLDFLVINTDGWVEGKEASAYKVGLVDAVGSSAVVGIQQGNELTPVLDSLRSIKTFVIDSPQLIQPRSREKRKLLRKLSYKKYLKGAKMQSFSFSWIKVEDSLLGAGAPLHHKRLNALTNLLGTRPIYSEESIGAILAVLKKSEKVTETQINDAIEHFGKPVKVIREGDEQGLLVGLKGEEDTFLGIGVLHEVDYKRKALKVYTPVVEKVYKLCFGQIKLNKNFREIGLSTVYSVNL